MIIDLNKHITKAKTGGSGLELADQPNFREWTFGGKIRFGVNMRVSLSNEGLRILDGSVHYSELRLPEYLASFSDRSSWLTTCVDCEHRLLIRSSLVLFYLTDITIKFVTSFTLNSG
ncbi:hypothetical protein CSKR_112655, partial [Clonorchis sinensis]